MIDIVGIDEAGRGPLAGPVAVGAVRVFESLPKDFFLGIKDSKKLSESDRELWFNLARVAKSRRELDYKVALVSERVIDKKGITYAINLGIKRCLRGLSVPEEARIFLDGGIKAPQSFGHQQSVIRGDEKIPVISLASILAKVTRDRRMKKEAKKFPEFGFESHKGYGTKAHRMAIHKHGLSSIHRRSFLGKLTSSY